MSAGGRSGVAGQVGRLLEAARVRARLSQGQVAERAGTSQQWVSRVERGEVDLRLGDADRLFAAVGRRVMVQTAWRGDEEVADPDLLGADDAAGELARVMKEHAFLWRRFAGVPYVVAGRLAALAQGLGVRPGRVDLVVAEAGLGAADGAMSWLNASRWSDTHQDWTGFDVSVSGRGPRRWRLTTGYELRIAVAATLPKAVIVAAGERRLPVVPLVRLLEDDPDVAELARRRAFRGGRGGGRIRA